MNFLAIPQTIAKNKPCSDTSSYQRKDEADKSA
jgi:hypothetical protein